MLLVGVWSLGGHRQSGVPVIEADSRPLRVKPANPGGLQVDGVNDSILSGESDAKAALAPPPETPQPQVLKAEEKAAAVAAPAPAKPPPALLSAAEPSRPAATAETKSVASPTSRPEPVASAKPVPVPAPPQPAAARQAAPVAAGGTVVQLAAVSSEEAAKAEWLRLEHRYGDLLAGHTPLFSRTEHAGKTFWRVRARGFADTAQAMQFCERVKAKGGGCAIASF
jgi:hypothetical protein